MANKTKVRFESTNIGGNGQVPALECNCISFFNPDGNTAEFTVNNVPVKPGCILVHACLANEIDTSNYQIKVNSTSEIYYVTRKFYVE